MKICYIANIRLPTEKAHGIQIMKTCEAFALLGHEVRIIVSKRHNPITQSAFDFYSIHPEARSRISVEYVSSPILLFLGKIGFWIQTWIFAELASIKMRRDYPDVIYSRDEIVLFNMYLIHPNLVWEAHQGSTNLVTRLLLKKAKLVAISHGLADLYGKFIGNPARILVSPDAVDLEEFPVSHSQSQCREAVGLPNTKIALYCGHLYGWKGAQIFADASREFSDKELAVFVGGTDRDIEEFRKKNAHNNHMVILGRKPHGEIPLYLASADVLVIPNSAHEKISSTYTSPLKLFEYMASGRAIVASDLSSIREILDEKTAVFFKPDDSTSLSSVLLKLFENSAKREELAREALKKVQNYSWENRAKSVLSFIENHT